MDMERRARSLILVVDDEVRTARALARMLRDDGFEVELAAHGASAVGRLSRDPVPDILVTELMIPYVDGMAVAQYARSRRPGMPVFVVTSYPEQMVALGGRIAPRPVVLPKPLDYAALHAMLRRAEDEHRRADRDPIPATIPRSRRKSPRSRPSRAARS